MLRTLVFLIALAVVSTSAMQSFSKERTHMLGRRVQKLNAALAANELHIEGGGDDNAIVGELGTNSQQQNQQPRDRWLAMMNRIRAQKKIAPLRISRELVKFAEDEADRQAESGFGDVDYKKAPKNAKLFAIVFRFAAPSDDSDKLEGVKICSSNYLKTKFKDEYKPDENCLPDEFKSYTSYGSARQFDAEGNLYTVKVFSTQTNDAKKLARSGSARRGAAPSGNGQRVNFMSRNPNQGSRARALQARTNPQQPAQQEVSPPPARAFERTRDQVQQFGMPSQQLLMGSSGLGLGQAGPASRGSRGMGGRSMGGGGMAMGMGGGMGMGGRMGAGLG